MSLVDEINAKLKEAMLARDQFLTGVLRDLKSAILYEEVAKHKRDIGLSDEEIETVIAREVKKRNDAIEIYAAAGNTTAADKETAEKEILGAFLPEPLDDDELREVIAKTIMNGEYNGPKDMGRVIGDIKREVGNRADGAKIASIVREMLK